MLDRGRHLSWILRASLGVCMRGCDPQSANKCSGGNILTAIMHPCHLILKVADVVLETLILPHLDGKEVVVLKFTMPNILCAEYRTSLKSWSKYGRRE